MGRALSLPASHEAHARPSRQAANDSYDEVMVGGLATACLTRAELARVMLHGLHGCARHGRGAQAGLCLQRPCHRARRPGRRLPRPFEQADIIHADGQAAVFASRMTSQPDPGAQRHHRFDP